MRLLEPFSGFVRGFLGSMPCVLLLWTLTGASPTRNPPDRELIAAEAESLWKGLAHVEVKGSQTYPSLKVTFGFELDFTNDGRSRMRNWKKTNDHQSWTESTIRDGKREILLSLFPHHPDVAHRARIQPQEGDRTHYVGRMNSFLWAWLPCAKPLHRLIAEGAELSFDDEQKNLLRVKTSYKNNPVTIVFDRQKDWLPRTVAFDGGGFRLEVDEYSRDQGRWLPIAGTSSDLSNTENGRRNRSTFRLSEFQVNRPIIDTNYDLPELPSGAIIVDQIKGTRSFVGTQADRIRLFERYDPDALKSDDLRVRQAALGEQSTVAPRFHLGRLFAGVAIFVASIGAMLIRKSVTQPT